MVSFTHRLFYREDRTAARGWVGPIEGLVVALKEKNPALQGNKPRSSRLERIYYTD
jgi:hypothetical protein